jgi:hypothetical protein
MRVYAGPGLGLVVVRARWVFGRRMQLRLHLGAPQLGQRADWLPLADGHSEDLSGAAVGVSSEPFIRITADSRS